MRLPGGACSTAGAAAAGQQQCGQSRGPATSAGMHGAGMPAAQANRQAPQKAARRVRWGRQGVLPNARRACDSLLPVKALPRGCCSAGWAAERPSGSASLGSWAAARWLFAPVAACRRAAVRLVRGRGGLTTSSKLSTSTSPPPPPASAPCTLLCCDRREGLLASLSLPRSVSQLVPPRGVVMVPLPRGVSLSPPAAAPGPAAAAGLTLADSGVRFSSVSLRCRLSFARLSLAMGGRRPAPAPDSRLSTGGPPTPVLTPEPRFRRDTWAAREPTAAAAAGGHASRCA